MKHAIFIISFVKLMLGSLAFADESSNMSQDFHSSHIPSLAATCAACHGTLGNSTDTTPTLAGLDKHYFISQMLGFKSGQHQPTVMHQHAQGLSDSEISALADYFAKQPRKTSVVPTPQKLESRHEP